MEHPIAGGQMANLTEAGATGSNAQASKKKKTAAKTAKLKSSAWYQGAVLSIGITRKSRVEKETGNEIARHQTLDRYRRS